VLQRAGPLIEIQETAPLERETSGDLLAVERDLRWFVWAGLSQGFPVWFGDVSPAAILGAHRVQLFALLRGRNIPFLVHSCDPITEGEFAQVPYVGKPAPPSKIVQVIEEMLRPGALQIGAQER
jgi:hypothetical protein